MKFTLKIIFSFCAVIFFAGCQILNKSQKEPQIDIIVEEALNFFEENSMLKSNIDWKQIREEIILKFPTMERDSSVRDEIIRWVIQEKQLKHHHFVDVEMLKKLDNPQNKNLKYPSGEILAGNIGFLNIPRFPARDSLLSVKYATKSQDFIRKFYQEGVDKWIIDLRENPGGNMWPMIVGLESLLGKNKLGSFYKVADSSVTEWYCTNGEGLTQSKDTTISYVKIESQDIDLSNQKVIVLTGENTASSGEAVAVAFKGRPNTLLIGGRTAGYSTGNDLFNLSNGAILVITTSVYMDRKGNRYENGVNPDSLIAEDAQILPTAISLLSKD